MLSAILKVREYLFFNECFPFKMECRFAKGKQHSNECSVEQFPLTLNYASTSHKIQGRTLIDQDIVCHGRMGNYKLPAGCGYVMLSRSTKLDNVFYLYYKLHYN